MKTSIIKYNLKDRGREFRGKNRNFNIPLICDYINGNECQERIRNRDMLGYYGHWIRTRFGLLPQEGANGVKGGRAEIVEPAFVTTHLKAYQDGTIEHQEEFLETDSGKVAEKLNTSRVGGFSSVIANQSNIFYGFDYVLEPNYTTNRGYELAKFDSVEDLTDDEWEAAIKGEQLKGALVLLDSASMQSQLANETIEHLRAENEELLELLASKGIDPNAVQDSILPVTFPTSPAEKLRKDISLFHATRNLPKVAEPSKTENLSEIIPFYSKMLNKYK